MGGVWVRIRPTHRYCQDDSAGKESACIVGDLSSIPGLGSSPGEGKGYPFQYSGLENSMDCIVHGVTKSWTQLSNFHVHWYCLGKLGKKLGKARVSELKVSLCVTEDFPGGSDGKMSACNDGDLGLIPGLGGSLEKERATHSSILAWRIPWMEEPGRLQSTGVAKSQTQLSYFTFIKDSCLNTKT